MTLRFWQNLKSNISFRMKMSGWILTIPELWSNHYIIGYGLWESRRETINVNIVETRSKMVVFQKEWTCHCVWGQSSWEHLVFLGGIHSSDIVMSTISGFQSWTCTIQSCVRVSPNQNSSQSLLRQDLHLQTKMVVIYGVSFSEDEFLEVSARNKNYAETLKSQGRFGIPSEKLYRSLQGDSYQWSPVPTTHHVPSSHPSWSHHPGLTCTFWVQFFPVHCPSGCQAPNP